MARPSVRNRTCGGPEAARRRSTILRSHDPRSARLAATRSVTRAVAALGGSLGRGFWTLFSASFLANLCRRG